MIAEVSIVVYCLPESSAVIDTSILFCLLHDYTRVYCIGNEIALYFMQLFRFRNMKQTFTVVI
jgi:hypothetical protein